MSIFGTLASFIGQLLGSILAALLPAIAEEYRKNKVTQVKGHYDDLDKILEDQFMDDVLRTSGPVR